MFSNDTDFNIAVKLNSLSGTPEGRAQILAEGLVPKLVELLSHHDDSIKEKAIFVVAGFASTPGGRAIILSSGIVPHLVELLNHTADSIQTSTVYILADLTVTLGGCAAILTTPTSAVPRLVGLLNHPEWRIQIKVLCVFANFAAASSDYNVVMYNGIITKLIDLLSHSRKEIIKETLRIFESLTHIFAGCIALLTTKAILPLTALLNHSSATIRGRAARVLTNTLPNVLLNLHNDTIREAALSILPDVTATPAGFEIILATGEMSGLVGLLSSADDRAKEVIIGMFANFTFKIDFYSEIMSNPYRQENYKLERFLKHIANEDAIEKTVAAFIKAIPILVGLLSHTNDNIKQAASRTLAYLALTADGNSALLAAQAWQPLISLMSHTNEGIKAQATYAFTHLALISGRPDKIAVGVKSLLIDLLSHSNDGIAIRAVMGLRNLLRYTPEILALGGVSALIGLLSHTNSDIQKQAARALATVASLSDECATIVVDKALAALISEVDVTNPPRRTAHALAKLAETSTGCEALLAVGAVKRLVFLLTHSKDHKDWTVYILANLALIPEGRVAIVTAGAMPKLTALLQDADDALRAQINRAISNINNLPVVTAANTGALAEIPVPAVAGSPSERQSHESSRSANRGHGHNQSMRIRKGRAFLGDRSNQQVTVTPIRDTTAELPKAQAAHNSWKMPPILKR